MILLVDNDITFIWGLKKYLQRRGYAVETAATLAEAREMIKQEAPLLICSDLCLPDGSGLELLAEVRTCNKDTPFIIASCYEKDDYEQEALQHGVTICMDKIKSALLKDKLVEYAYKELSEEQPPTFHKLLYLHTDNSKAEVLRAQHHARIGAPPQQRFTRAEPGKDALTVSALQRVGIEPASGGKQAGERRQ